MKNCFKVKLDTKKLDNLIDGYKKDKYKVKVGILGSAGSNENGLSMASIGIVHEFGSINKKIPERSFIRLPLNNHLKEKIQTKKTMFKELLFNEKTIKLAYEKLGMEAKSIIQESFVNKGDKTWSKNAKSTIKQKGVDNPLIDTGRLSKSIDYEVIKNT